MTSCIFSCVFWRRLFTTHITKLVIFGNDDNMAHGISLVPSEGNTVVSYISSSHWETKVSRDTRDARKQQQDLKNSQDRWIFSTEHGTFGSPPAAGAKPVVLLRPSPLTAATESGLVDACVRSTIRQLFERSDHAHDTYQ